MSEKKWPRKFRVCASVTRKIVMTELRLPGDHKGCVVVKGGDTLEMTKDQYQRLFLHEDGAVYDPKLFIDVEEEKARKAVEEATAKAAAAKSAAKAEKGDGKADPKADAGAAAGEKQGDVQK